MIRSEVNHPVGLDNSSSHKTILGPSNINCLPLSQPLSKERPTIVIFDRDRPLPKVLRRSLMTGSTVNHPKYQRYCQGSKYAFFRSSLFSLTRRLGLLCANQLRRIHSSALNLHVDHIIAVGLHKISRAS